LLEIEEVIEYRKAEAKLAIEDEKLKGYSQEKKLAKIEEMRKSGSILKIEGIKKLKDDLVEKWIDRLNGCQYSMEVWQ